MSDTRERADRLVDGETPETIEVETERLEHINKLLADAMEKANVSADKPIRTSRAMALKQTEEAHVQLSELLPGWHPPKDGDEQ